MWIVPASEEMRGVSTAVRSVSRGMHTWIKFIRWQDLVADKERFDKNEEATRRYIPNTGGMYFSAERPLEGMFFSISYFLWRWLCIITCVCGVAAINKPVEDITREEHSGVPFDLLAKHYMMRTLDHSKDAIRRYNEYMKLVEDQYDQR